MTTTSDTATLKPLPREAAPHGHVHRPEGVVMPQPIPERHYPTEREVFEYLDGRRAGVINEYCERLKIPGMSPAQAWGCSATACVKWGWSSRGSLLLDFHLVIRYTASMTTTTPELKQVGRDCLQAYTGLANPEHLCAAAELLFSVSDILGAAEDEGFGGEGGLRYLTSIESYLPFVCASIRTTGWLSRTVARQTDKMSTADHALTYGVYWKPPMRESERVKPEEQDYNLSNAVITFCEEFFAERDVMALSDYENSLRVAMGSGIVHPKFVGIIASAVQFYNKDLERRAFAESKSKMFAESKFLGQEKDRLVFENVQVISYRTFESDFGVRHFYSFRTPEGSCLTTWTGRDLHLAIGQTLSVKGTVKKHETYQPKVKGAPAGNAYAQTVLSRVALVTRAKVAAYEVEAKEETKVVEGPHYVNPDGSKVQAWQAQPGAVHVEAKEETKTVKYHRYHLVAEDGRKYLCTSKSKKKVLVPGYEAVVEYDAEDLSRYNNGERPVSLVA